MFNKKSCKKCGKKINPLDKYCSSCGFAAQKKKDYGMLGKNDFEEGFDNLSNSLLGGMGGSILNKMLGNAMKMLEKEMQKEGNNKKSKINQPRTNFQLYINGKKVNMSDTEKTNEQPEKEIQEIELPKNTLKGYAKLKKQEPKANIRRLSDSVIYEIEMPGVNSLDNININKVHNSIEIKAKAKNKAYFKIITIDLPITFYELEDNTLILEFSEN